MKLTKKETLPPAHKAQGIESSYTATINAARPILLCEKRVKSLHPHAATADRQYNKNNDESLLYSE